MKVAVNEKDILAKVKPYAHEVAAKSYLAMAETLIPYLVSFGFMVFGKSLLVQLSAMLVFTLVNIRFFLLYHDFAHGALFRAKTRTMKAMRAIMEVYGFSILLTKELWAETHNRHHQHNSKLDEIFIGQVPIVSTDKFFRMNRIQKFFYLFFRQPLIIPFGYITSFALPAVLVFLQAPRRKSKILVAVTWHASLLLLILHFVGAQAFFIYLASQCLTLAFLKYLFNLQHSFPDAHYYPKDEWTMVKASLDTTSFFQMSPWGHWLTANIGFHHIHHLNPKIPFYHLPKAMANIPELQNPRVVSWHPRSVFGVLFGTAAWSQDRKAMVSFGELLQDMKLRRKA